MKDSTPSTKKMKIIPPATSPTPSTALSPKPPRPRSEWQKEVDEEEKRMLASDLSKVKVW